MVETHRIGIIGAGISGIAAAKRLALHDPVVLEATGSIGGVWSHCSFGSTRLQTPRLGFQFSDFPWARSVTAEFPTHVEVLEYLRAYAAHFDVLRHIRLNSRVVELRHVGGEGGHSPEGPGGKSDYGALLGGGPAWEVGVVESDGDCVKWYCFEMIVVCTGKYGDVARAVEFPTGRGPEVFEGRVVHTMDYSKLDKEEAQELVEGKRVVIVGSKKSAMDLAMECALANRGSEGKACTMVMRTPRWAVPSYKIWGLPFFLFFSTRSAQFFHDKPNQSLFMSLLCLASSPWRRVVSKFIESYLLWKLPLEKYGVRPEHTFEEDYAACQWAVLPENFYSEVGDGKIVLMKKPNKWWFWDKGLEFDDETKVEADVVVLATGFDGTKKLLDLLPSPFSDHLVDSSGTMPLYRGTIHPLIPNMAIMGYVESVSNLATSELRSTWLARLVDDKFKLPSIEKMLEETRKEVEVMKRTTRFYKRQCVSTFNINHSDQICLDMGIKSWRKSNWFYEAFQSYSSRDYKDSNT